MVDVQDTKPNVVVIGGSALVCAGLRHVLSDIGMSLDCVPAESAESVMVASADAPELIIVDGHGERDDLLLCAALRRRFQDSRIVLMSDEGTLDKVAKSFEAGVDGYLAKATPCASLSEALKLIMLGEKFMPASAFDGLADLRPAGDGRLWQGGGEAHRLSDREIEILACVADGEPNKAIAWRLDISEATVKVHIKTILRKLGVSNRTQAAIWAVGRGLGQSDGGQKPHRSGRGGLRLSAS